MRQNCKGKTGKNNLKNPDFVLSNPNDLCEYYKCKAKRLEERFDELNEMLEKLNLTYRDNAKLQSEVQSRIFQVSQLQQSLSDLQVFLFREREENLRLAAENDSLRIKDYENKKCIDVLLKLSGITREQLEDLLTTNRKHKSERRTGKESDGCGCTARSSKDQPDKEAVVTKDSLLLEIKSLKTQLENLRVLFRTEVDVLLKDREVIAEERKRESRKLNDHLANVTANLAKAQEHVKETVSRLLEVQKEREAEKNVSRREKEDLVKYASSFSCSSTDTAGCGCATTPRCRICSNRQLLERVNEQERLTTIYQRQCKQLDVQMKKWKDRAELAEKVLAEKTQHLTADLAVMRNRCEDLDRRRLLEAEGFRTDIRMLRERLKELDKKLEKMKMMDICGGKDAEDADFKMAKQKTLERARQLEKEVLALKHKFNLFIDDDNC